MLEVRENQNRPIVFLKIKAITIFPIENAVIKSKGDLLT